MSPQKKCAVPGCYVDQSCSGIRWFNIPEHNSLTSSVQNGKTVYYSRRRIWLEKLGISDGPSERLANVCSLHFKEEDFTDPQEGAILKEDAIPSQNLPNRAQSDVVATQLETNESQEIKKNINDIETVEKSDEDDDVEIIEPHREIITVDDDDVEADSYDKAMENDTGVKSEKTVAFNNVKGQETESSGNLMCMSPEAITHSLKHAITKQSVTKPEAIPSGKSLLIKKRRINEMESKDLKNSNVCHYMTPNGRKYLIKMAKVEPPTAVTTAGVSNSQNRHKLIKFDKEHLQNELSRIQNKRGSLLTDADLSEALALKLSEKVKQTAQRKGPLGKDFISKPSNKSPSSMLKGIRIVDVHQSNNYQPIKNNNESTSSLKFGKGQVVQVGTNLVGQKINILSPKKGLISLPNGLLGKIIPHNPIPSLMKMPQAGRLSAGDKVAIPRLNNKKKEGSNTPTQQVEKDNSFKYVNIEEIIKNKIVKDEPLEESDKEDFFLVQATKEKGEQTDLPIGIGEIYNYIQKNMIDFTYEVFGKKYVLSQCALHFRPVDSRCIEEENIVFVSDMNMTSTDTTLLSGMNFSIHGSTPLSEYQDVVKKVSHKHEIIAKAFKPMKTNNMTKNSNIDNKSQTTEREKVVITPKCLNTDNNSERKRQAKPLPKKQAKKNTNGNVTVVEKDQKIVITPTFLVTSEKNMNELPTVGIKTFEAHEKKIDKDQMIIKKKRIPKSSLSRSRRMMRLPSLISQMQPALRGRLPVDRNRFRKNKRLGIELEKEIKTPEKTSTLEAMEIDNNEALTEKTKITNTDPPQLGNPEDSTQSPLGSRTITRGKKKDYRNLSIYGTTEEIKRTKTKRKILSYGGGSPKKLKYSDKVGDIESFLEVVLEPDNKEISKNTDQIETTLNSINE